jgi:hypothetical protein
LCIVYCVLCIVYCVLCIVYCVFCIVYTCDLTRAKYRVLLTCTWVKRGQVLSSSPSILLAFADILWMWESHDRLLVISTPRSFSSCRRATKLILNYPPHKVLYPDRLRILGLLLLWFCREVKDLILLFKCCSSAIHLNCDMFLQFEATTQQNFDPNNRKIITDDKQNY